MRPLFATQSKSLWLFHALAEELRRHVDVERCGFTLADSWSYRDWLEEQPDFEQRGHLLLKEWEITGQRRGTPDLSLLAKYEQELDDDLFGAIVADRRLFMGPDCTFRQDYRRRFSDDELLCILQAAVVATDDLFQQLRPDVVVSFVCVTIFDYLCYLFAKARGVPLLNLRPTKIEDRNFLGSTLKDPSPELIDSYEKCLRGGSRYLDQARGYIDRVRRRDARYEGVVLPSSAPAQRIDVRRNPARKTVNLCRRYARYKHSEAATDNHVPDIIRSLVFTGLVNPLRAKRVSRHLEKHYVGPDDLKLTRYAFFPLHTEPEVSLLVYGRPFMNQIEVIRTLATSLPVDMTLVVKEHPWMVGKRSPASYRKMLNIPRVRLARPELEARILIQGADVVTVITSSVGQESAILRRPVVTLGDCAFNLLPDSMVSRCTDLTRLPSALRGTLACHSHDEESLLAYVAAIMEVSESINLYSVLLGRAGVHVERPAGFGEETEKLAVFTLQRLEAASPASAPLSG